MHNIILKITLLLGLTFLSQSVFSKDLTLENEIEKSKVRVKIATLVASDEAVRDELLTLEKKGYDLGKLYKDSSFVSYWLEIDHKNQVELKKIIAKYGWPKASIYGQTTEQSAWLLAQHAYHDPAFQKKVLQFLRNEPGTDIHRNRNMALLEDRILMMQGLPQIYGSQGKCAGPHHWVPDPIKDPEHLIERRNAIGMESYQEYQKNVDALCV